MNRIIFCILVLVLFPFQPGFVFAVSLDKTAYQSNETAIVFSGPIGGSNIIVYNLSSLDIVFASGLGDQPMEIQLTNDIFVSGDYIIVNTKELNGCQNFTLDECRANPDYVSENFFQF